MGGNAAAQVVFGAGESGAQHACAGRNTALLTLFVLLIRLLQVRAHAIAHVGTCTQVLIRTQTCLGHILPPVSYLSLQNIKTWFVQWAMPA